jgi:hypothetical protein
MMSDDPDEWLGTTSDDTDIIVLHRFFQTHADKIGKELLSFSKPSSEGEEESSAAAGGKTSWDALCAILIDLGEALEVPRLSLAPSSEHREYIDLMTRYANRNTDAVRDIFVETPLPQVSLPFFLASVSLLTLHKASGCRIYYAPVQG